MTQIAAPKSNKKALPNFYHPRPDSAASIGNISSSDSVIADDLYQKNFITPKKISERESLRNDGL